MNEVREIRRRVLRIEQDPQHPLYLFGMTGAELLEIADISRVSRDDAGKLLGYQRAEVKKHVQNIVDYLNSGPVLFPNSIILALSSDVHFAAAGDRMSVTAARQPACLKSQFERMVASQHGL